MMHELTNLKYFVFFLFVCSLIGIIIIFLIGLGADESAGKYIELLVVVVVVVVVVVIFVVKMQDGILSFRKNSMPYRYTGTIARHTL
jgi:peptidoglycan/LPS O-acetylase OafA/YrhL